MEMMILLCWMLTTNPAEICPPLPVEKPILASNPPIEIPRPFNKWS
ncbi:MAG: hypothetical protein H7836_12310 [Magnetococcus sp. YQC-3]